jgi:hypothetical protein
VSASIRAREPRPAGRSIRAEVGAALWLQSRDLLHLGGRRALGPSLIAGYAALSALLIAGGFAMHAQHRSLPIGALFTPIFLLWALLPAVGAGGGSLDAAASLAPYPTGPAMQLSASWFSALTDVQYLLPVPMLFAATSADFGAAALPGAVAFVAGASAIGQLAGWLSVAGLRARRGQSLLMTSLAVLVLGAVVVLRRSHDADTRRLGTIPPTRWLSDGGRAAAHGDWAAALGWWALLATPLLLFVVAGPPLVRRATVARLAGSSGRGTGKPFARSPYRALAAASWRGIVRSTAWRASLLSAVAVPFLTTLLSQPLSYRALTTVAVVSTAASIAANTWSFEAGGSALLLSAPMSRRGVVVVRAATLCALLAGALGVATAAAVVAGSLHGSPADVGFACCVLIVITAAGMRTSIAGASAVDVDALRARPARLTAVLAFGGRCLVGGLLLAGLWAAGPIGAALAAAGAVGYAAWALRGTRRRLEDGASLLAAFATTR